MSTLATLSVSEKKIVALYRSLLPKYRRVVPVIISDLLSEQRKGSPTTRGARKAGRTKSSVPRK